MGQADALVDVLDPPYQGGEQFEKLAGELRDLRKRWDNRLVLERCSLAELYLHGRLEIVLYGDWLLGPNQYVWACRGKAERDVLDGRSHEDGANIDNGDHRNEVIVLPVIVEGVKVPKTLVRSVFRTYLFKKEFC